MGKLPERSSKRGPKTERGVLTEAIVTAARGSFARNGYAATSMRSIAQQVGVDPRLVGYYFTSKQALLEACLNPPPGFLEGVAQVTTSDLETRGRSLVSFLLTSWEDPASSEVLRSIMLIAAHQPIALERLQLVVRGSLINAVTASLADQERLIRGGLVATQMLGLAMTRYIWRIEPIVSMPRSDVIDYIAPTIQRYLTGSLTTDRA
jgi:AcrR family transcriptional regulator